MSIASSHMGRMAHDLLGTRTAPGDAGYPSGKFGVVGGSAAPGGVDSGRPPQRGDTKGVGMDAPSGNGETPMWTTHYDIHPAGSGPFAMGDSTTGRHFPDEAMDNLAEMH